MAVGSHTGLGFRRSGAEKMVTLEDQARQEMDLMGCRGGGGGAVADRIPEGVKLRRYAQ